MPPTEEKRTQSRFKCHCSACYAIFARSVFYHSRIVDFSDAGMRLRTKVPVKIGATLMVRVTGPLPDSRTEVDFRCPTNRSIGIGQVRWCQKSGRYEAESYELGLEFQIV